jgi:AraC-like DNA-binding protein
LTNFIHLSRKLCDFQLVPISSTFSFEKPDYHILFDATFGNNLTFCGNKNALKFDISFLDINLKTYNPYIKSLLIKKIIKKKNSHIKKMQKEKIINKSVIYDLISLNLKDRNANINTISSSLSISRQTLHRHLKQEHTSFKKILSEVRMNKSLELLSDQSLTTTKVSEILGYNEVSSFYSAFKIWHGFTVSEFKKTMLKNDLIVINF